MIRIPGHSDHTIGRGLLWVGHSCLVFFVPASAGAARRAAVKAWERVRVKGVEAKRPLTRTQRTGQHQQTTWVVEKEAKGHVLPLLLLEV